MQGNIPIKVHIKRIAYTIHTGICIVLVGVTVIAPTTTTDVVDDRAIADTESVTKFSRRPTLSIGGIYLKANSEMDMLLVVRYDRYAFSIWTLVSHDVTPDNEYQLIRSKSKLQQPPQTTENTPLIAPVTVMGLPLNPLPDPVTMRTVNVDLAHLGSV
ncbi:hypothetical protein SARC_03252 [Sphaeroforma arctica JP610]|uniref:Uncharacterized protein n=1 Tax=Sphaeroforma arctica JP610 TaxID=667725 RepID=A0A0L0G6L8_9EUKA|nr:hypothetical protein SARC_03252 [Sphaeroforma arctica JP610]KNC84526.1 hypothetical protein SARC_03252 [Sphaeroforma arctica JP610]|eukprot:XP_014158428.1 hypothetical protein SARC_03252 [Sphaeroforma arctica JP610]